VPARTGVRGSPPPLCLPESDVFDVSRVAVFFRLQCCFPKYAKTFFDVGTHVRGASFVQGDNTE